MDALQQAHLSSGDRALVAYNIHMNFISFHAGVSLRLSAFEKKHARTFSFCAMRAGHSPRGSDSISNSERVLPIGANGILKPGDSRPATPITSKEKAKDGNYSSLSSSFRVNGTVGTSQATNTTRSVSEAFPSSGLSLSSSASPSTALSSPSPSSRLVELPQKFRGVKDYMQRALEFLETEDNYLCWFCPLECGAPPKDAPLLLFLPGIDGTGLGIIRHYESLGRMFEVWCLHIPTKDRTPFEGLVKHVETAIIEASHKTPSKPIYLVGDSFGGSLALAVAARNPGMDLVLVLANPSTSIENSQLQPLFPILERFPDPIYQAVPYLLGFVMGDPVRMASATVDTKLTEIEKIQMLCNNLVSMVPVLGDLAEVIPKKSLQWKLELLKAGALYANSRLHAVKGQVLILASGKDQLLPSRLEAERLQKALPNCVVRYYKDAGHSLLLEDGLDLGNVIRGALMYRKSKKFDPVADYVYPTTKEAFEIIDNNKFLLKMTSPVFFSTKEDGTIVRGLSGVPEEGPILLVGYHMLMGMELYVLYMELMKRNQLLRGVAHPVLFTRFLEQGVVEPGYVDDIRIFGGFPLGKKNFFKVLSRRECALLYPGGAREALHRKGEAYKLFWPEQSEFVRAAARFGYTIVPFGAVGEDDLVEELLDYNDMKRIPFILDIFKEVNANTPKIRPGQSGEVADQYMHLPLLAPKVPGRFYFRFGKPFRTSGRETELQNKEIAGSVYRQIKDEVEQCLNYLLRKREEDPYRSLFPRLFYESLWGEEWQASTFDPSDDLRQ
ncbi:hypothetical protein KP509_35G007500 [Ceratopteris richardii]|uniref:Serine aminopeptidase S33 domain-containing protein n=1 Tax=Ceratopteris richardii TaxID=49495 RepID=A0A8T2QD76_CERRI|nr:hypothetical protein KP509_35G007500 [Ceratopteris richardii]